MLSSSIVAYSFDKILPQDPLNNNVFVTLEIKEAKTMTTLNYNYALADTILYANC
jgi:hypothetical protein